ncbi:TonB-dependent receptor domain-containing protein [Longitalea arenae]|uniref:TonB-dependent receptor domain-containing protein n=1 Tax=Longitalea arenae TaxID=2812558 RepID=UPI001967790D|nr:TonB-dependent receptor [Longitalea arenae]
MKYSLLLLLLLSTVISHAQSIRASVGGVLRDSGTKAVLAYVNITLHHANDSSLFMGTISNDKGRFLFENIPSGNYLLTCSYIGYAVKTQPLLVGKLNNFIDLGALYLTAYDKSMAAVTVTAQREPITAKMDKKTFSLAANVSQSGGSVLEAIKNLPGISTEDGKVQLRGSDKVMILIDGKQTALTGFGSQSGLENIPASAIEKIEIINNPSAKYDANGNAGIINIIYKKENREGLNGKVGIAAGAGALWIKKENYPTIRPQYTATPKINPSVSLNYRKRTTNIFLQADNLNTKTLNRNEFVDRYYDNGDTVKQQTKRNRSTNIVTVKSGIDWLFDAKNTFTLSGLFSSEKILDRGDEPFFNADLKERRRLWQFLEDELKTTATASISWQHKFERPGRSLNANFNYTFHREDEKYFFTNIMPAYTGRDSFALISDEHVADVNLDYVQPLRYGRFETGIKFRRRFIPVNMHFKPGFNSVLDTTAGGWADYAETIPAFYGNYILESSRFEIEAGMRLEYVHVEYNVNPHHAVYKSDRYHYLQPFGNIRLGYKIDDNNKLSLFYNRRIDRPNEVDIRIFPKYDDAEIIKVGNPGLRPQFTNTFELGYKTEWTGGFFFSSAYHKRMKATITRIGSVVPGSTLIYNIFQNAGKSYSSGMELLISQNLASWAMLGLNMNGYKNIIDSFTVFNKYPADNIYYATKAKIFSGNIKLNAVFRLPKHTEAQMTAIYQAPDLVPQGKTFSRFSIDVGVKKIIQRGQGELFLNATDVANTLQLKKEIYGNGFRYISTDYYETQVFRLGYNYKF